MCILRQQRYTMLVSCVSFCCLNTAAFWVCWSDVSISSCALYGLNLSYTLCKSWPSSQTLTMYRTREEQGICHRQTCCKFLHLYGYTTLTGIIMLAMLVTFVTFVSYHYHIHILWFQLSGGKDSYWWGVDWDWGALLDISILSEDLSRFLFDWMDLLAKIVFSCVVSPQHVGNVPTDI